MEAGAAARSCKAMRPQVRSWEVADMVGQVWQGCALQVLPQNAWKSIETLFPFWVPYMARVVPFASDDRLLC